MAPEDAFPALTSVAFLAVYREGVETVLFYKALLVAGPASGAVVPVALGIAAASAVLGVVYVLINRFGVRLNLPEALPDPAALTLSGPILEAGAGGDW